MSVQVGTDQIRKGTPGTPGKAALLPTALAEAAAKSIEAVIFLDVDGVLNIGVDDGHGPLVLSEPNLDIVREARGRHMSEESWVAVEKIAFLAEQRADFVTSADWQVSENLMRNLVRIIALVGGRVAVVLASNWRKDHYASKVQRLQEEISKHLGRQFAFDAKTPIQQDVSPSDRLRLIGDFMVGLGKQRDGLTTPLQALVLDDFFAQDADGWQLDGALTVSSVADAEGYLIRRVGDSASCGVQVKIVHCYDAWTTPTGLEVKAGGGLTMERTSEALAFLLDGDGGALRRLSCSTRSPSKISVPGSDASSPGGSTTMLPDGWAGEVESSQPPAELAGIKLPPFPDFCAAGAGPVQEVTPRQTEQQSPPSRQVASRRTVDSPRYAMVRLETKTPRRGRVAQPQAPQWPITPRAAAGLSPLRPTSGREVPEVREPTTVEVPVHAFEGGAVPGTWFACCTSGWCTQAETN